MQIKLGYSIVFLIKKDIDIEELKYRQINEDMLKILKKAEMMKEKEV